MQLETGYYLIYGKGALRQAKVKAFRDWILGQMSTFRDKKIEAAAKPGAARGEGTV